MNQTGSVDWITIRVLANRLRGFLATYEQGGHLVEVEDLLQRLTGPKVVPDEAWWMGVCGVGRSLAVALRVGEDAFDSLLAGDSWGKPDRVVEYATKLEALARGLLADLDAATKPVATGSSSASVQETHGG
jgi:hypothetical protein